MHDQLDVHFNIIQITAIKISSLSLSIFISFTIFYPVHSSRARNIYQIFESQEFYFFFVFLASR